MGPDYTWPSLCPCQAFRAIDAARDLLVTGQEVPVAPGTAEREPVDQELVQEVLFDLGGIGD